MDCTGRMELIGGETVGLADFRPSPRAAALHLGRTFRFRGGVQTWWTVLHHLHLCYRLAARAGDAPEVRREALLHDVPEVLTGDWPGPCLPPYVADLQARLLWQVRAAWGFLPPEPDVLTRVAALDAEALRLEAWHASVLVVERYPAAFGPAAPRGPAVEDLADLAGRAAFLPALAPNAARPDPAADPPLVREYVRLVCALQEAQAI